MKVACVPLAKGKPEPELPGSEFSSTSVTMLFPRGQGRLGAAESPCVSSPAGPEPAPGFTPPHWVRRWAPWRPQVARALAPCLGVGPGLLSVPSLLGGSAASCHCLCCHVSRLAAQPWARPRSPSLRSCPPAQVVGASGALTDPAHPISCPCRFLPHGTSTMPLSHLSPSGAQSLREQARPVWSCCVPTTVPGSEVQRTRARR